MRGSEPMPTRTFSMSAPKRSAMFASSFMKLILVASMALAAYLVSSAERTSMTIMRSWLRVKGSYSARISSVRARIVGADDDPVGLHEVLDRRAFLQEFGVRDHVELDAARRALGECSRDRRAHLVGRAHRHGGLGDDDRCSGHVRADGARDRRARSAGPPSRPHPGGVPTAMSWNRPCSTPLRRRS